MSKAAFDIKLAIKSLLPRAFEVLEEMVNDPKDPLRRERGMHIVIERNIGKVVQVTEVQGKDGGAIQVEDNTPAIRILLQAALPKPVIIEGEIE